jgi:hypothetical protein
MGGRANAGLKRPDTRGICPGSRTSGLTPVGSSALQAPEIRDRFCDLFGVEDSAIADGAVICLHCAVPVIGVKAHCPAEVTTSDQLHHHLNVAIRSAVSLDERDVAPDDLVGPPHQRRGPPRAAQIQCLAQGQQVDRRHGLGQLDDSPCIPGRDRPQANFVLIVASVERENTVAGVAVFSASAVRAEQAICMPLNP